MPKIIAGVCFFLCLSMLPNSLSATSTRLSRLPIAQHWPDLMTKYGKLSKFWAQAASAAPEARAYVEQLDVSLASPHIGIMDSGFGLNSIVNGTELTPELHAYLTAPRDDTERASGSIVASMLPTPLNSFIQPLYDTIRSLNPDPIEHGSAITHLIASKTSAVGSSVRGRISLLLPIPTALDFKDEIKLFDMFATTLPSLPPLISHSLGFVTEARRKYHDRGDIESVVLASTILPLLQKTIFVSAAGNDPTLPIEIGKVKQAEDMIIVGNTDPTGHVSSLSSRGKEEVVRAFCDKYLQTIGVEEGVFTDFGGTSGATPQVVAALADVLSIVHTLNRNEAATLLRRTAVASAYGDEAGTLNRYKLVRVAHRLVQHGWPTSKAALHDDSIYDFSDEAQALLAASFSASTSAEAFTQLRQAFFLDPDSSQTRTLLAAIYRQAGYEAESLFYGTAADSEARDAFIKRMEEKLVAALAKFMAAVAAVDLEEMAKLLGTFSKRDFLENMSAFFDEMRKLSVEQQQSIADFLRQHKIYELKVPVYGTIGMGNL